MQVCGDKNTNFFQKKMASNRRRNEILSICDEHGNKLEDPAALKKVASSYRKLLGTKFALKKDSTTAEGDCYF